MSLESGAAVSALAREAGLHRSQLVARARAEFAGVGTDGILFALEVQGLNLDDTELVTPSACDTAQRSLDYSESVLGLAAFGGRRNVLVTLWKLNDGEARDFMVDFYKIWLSQTRSDPTKALRGTQLSWLK